MVKTTCPNPLHEITVQDTDWRGLWRVPVYGFGFVGIMLSPILAYLAILHIIPG